MLEELRKFRYTKEVAGIVIGAVAGWCYWKFVGCASGSCPITSSPWNSSVYGAVMGLLSAKMFEKKQPDNQ